MSDSLFSFSVRFPNIPRPIIFENEFHSQSQYKLVKGKIYETYAKEVEKMENSSPRKEKGKRRKTKENEGKRRKTKKQRRRRREEEKSRRGEGDQAAASLC